MKKFLSTIVVVTVLSSLTFSQNESFEILIQKLYNSEECPLSYYPDFSQEQIFDNPIDFYRFSEMFLEKCGTTIINEPSPETGNTALHYIAIIPASGDYYEEYTTKYECLNLKPNHYFRTYGMNALVTFYTKCGAKLDIKNKNNNMPIDEMGYAMYRTKNSDIKDLIDYHSALSSLLSFHYTEHDPCLLLDKNEDIRQEVLEEDGEYRDNYDSAFQFTRFSFSCKDKNEDDGKEKILEEKEEQNTEDKPKETFNFEDAFSNWSNKLKKEKK